MPSLTTSQKVAIAVTVPLAALVLYVLLKWGRDDAEEFEESADETQEFATSSESVLEVEIPQSFVGAVIGRGGSNVKQIQRESQTRINMKDDIESDGEENEGKERTRILLIRGSRERAKQAELLIRKVIAEQPVVEKTTMAIPQRVIGRIIGKGGKTIRQLCRISGARITIERGEEISDIQTCKISGSQTQIECAKQLLYEKINEDKVCLTREQRASEDNATRDNLSYILLPTDGNYFGVYISAMESPGRFWIQAVTKDSQHLDDLVEEMTVYYGDQGEGYTLNAPKVDDLCCTPFQHDRSWYRGKVTNVISTSEVQIRYLDFGDSGRVPISNVKELRMEFCQLSFQAVECHLANIKPKDGEWSQKACNLFEKLSCCAQWKVLMAQVVHFDNGVASIKLFDTNGEQDINIEEELVNQDWALYIDAGETDKDEDLSENPKNVSIDSPCLKVDQEAITTEEQLITTQEVGEQYQAFQFNDESLEMDDPSFEFTSADSSVNENSHSLDVTPLNTREPVNEPTVSAVEHTVVSCADVSKLSSLLNWESPENDSGELEENNTTSVVAVITADESPVASDEPAGYSPEIPAHRGVAVNEGMLKFSVFSPSETLARKDDSDDDQELSNQATLTSESLPEELLESRPVAGKHYTALDPYSETVVGTSIKNGINGKQEENIHSLGNEPESSKYGPRRSVPDDVIADVILSERPKSAHMERRSKFDVSPRKNEVDGRVVLTSNSAGSLQGHILKGGKRFLAPNFNQAPSSNVNRQENENDEEQDEEDDDSLYLSAREDSDSTGFISATGSTIDLLTTDSESDVTPSGYLSDTDEDWNEGEGGDKMNGQTTLDNTLLAEKLEQCTAK